MEESSDGETTATIKSFEKATNSIQYFLFKTHSHLTLVTQLQNSFHEIMKLNLQVNPYVQFNLNLFHESWKLQVGLFGPLNRKLLR